ncbi:hypothetical protein SMGD1_0105 [Sulfurimonas gotlandica GD1]|jgi:Mg2+ and Co2+ transporter CorA|uniref:Uncharacterized protein n=1 Tax=Sulfurimonas gotlandica (strain DSM 19862 / JCM 16533 / GD1) TaxID=929558 RepID=B6BLH5_SULGG|nr:hypothetical protein [Sulfurimonas gotlandica]EDZ62023.1 hypothetical protein CBGD1_2602 [Sulfurimonas gotlandica GD1]EHP28632.1 hypothetical protein SMGD1_0105 [Sulfurimonas gotlandica GD1]
MLKFSKLLAIFSILAIIYSVYGMNLEQENVVFYIGTLIASITVFVVSIGILTISVISKKESQINNLDK